MKLRVAGPADADIIKQIAQAAFGKDNPLPDQVVDQQLAAGRTAFLLAADGQGFLSYSQVLDEIEIGDLAVLPEAQGQGIGSCLLKELLDKQPNSRFYLEVKEGNHRALALYQRLGFQAYRTRPHYYQDGQAAILMEKKA
ncbi:ribosomal protein S18-alanine N-acetyltransferase [Fructobacillus parabroussonetiae]|uniref:[Ribosomal protein bS18]-alanine N-acetyltransferase n=1 Tax=Fructobacillus parabroussonetiae TaxID=2713174 RepID=A0ABS5QV97_9LACO|nr:ribosomal protein S18-alanine N-acetyltransferase [Fructobacillus parabroussonetiae]MBS9337031.1 ribosomal protein S18-alanine N-acetyltransferase [Fructobacillus parabroussonetiae]